MNQAEQYLREVLTYDPKAIVQAFEHDIKGNTYKRMKKENIVPLVEALLNEEDTVIEDDLQGVVSTVLMHTNMEKDNNGELDISTGKLIILHIYSKEY